MNNKKRKLNKTKVRVCAIILLLIIVILIGIGNNARKNRYKDLTILLNNEFIETKNEVIIDEEKNIYFSKEDIQELFDSTIYFNEAEKDLITTYNTHIAILKIDENNCLIDDAEIELKVPLKEIEGKIYLPISDIYKTYDIDIEYRDETNRIVMESTLLEKKVATLSKKAVVHERKGFFNGKNFEDLIIGEKVTVIEESGKYKKVRTIKGNLGYVKSKKLSNETVLRETVKDEKQDICVYDDYSNISGIYDNISVDTSKMNVVIPTFFHINKESKTLDKTTSSTATYAVYKKWVEENNLQMLPVVTNDENVSANLLSYSQRSEAILSLRDLVLQHSYIGINIKFDSIDDVNSFYRFILELYPRFKAAGIKVALTINDHKIERSRIENVVDYILED